MASNSKEAVKRWLGRLILVLSMPVWLVTYFLTAVATLFEDTPETPKSIVVLFYDIVVGIWVYGWESSGLDEG